MPQRDLSGKIVEFLYSGDLRLARVTRQSQDKLQITDAHGKQHRLHTKQVIVAHPVAADAANFGELAGELERRILAARAEVDTELLWESLADDIRNFDPDDLARGYFGEADSAQISALFRAVLADPVHFKIRGRVITPLDPDQVATRMRTIRKREERRALKEKALRWVEGLLAAPAGEQQVPPELEGFVERVDHFLLRGEADDVARWLEEADAGRAAREVAFDILVRIGRLPQDADPRLVFAGVRIAFPDSVREESGNLREYAGEPGREDFTALTAFAIDDEDTREVDDALTVQRREDTIRVGIHIADVAFYVARQTALDREAFRRGASLYLPYCSVPMFPERLSCDLASLQPDRIRPSMSFIVDFRPSGEIRDSRIVRGQVRVARRLTYDAADGLLETGDGGEIGSGLGVLRGIAERMERERRERGALVIRRPELKLGVVDGRVSVKVLDGSSPSRAIVSEMMILANRLAAEYASSREVPLIYRTQDSPTEVIELPDRYDPVAMDRVFRALKRSQLSLRPSLHSGLGVDAYTQMTSPIRRYQDLALQRQLGAVLAGAEPCYEAQELLEVLGSAQVVEGENRNLERETNQEYVLRYLNESLLEEVREAVVLMPISGGYLVELDALAVRGRMLVADGHEPGDRLAVRIQHVDPGQGVLLFEPA